MLCAHQATLAADQEFERFTSTIIQRDIEDEARGRAKHITPGYALKKVHDAGAQVVKSLLELKRRCDPAPLLCTGDAARFNARSMLRLHYTGVLYCAGF